MNKHDIVQYTEDELVQLMLSDSMLVSKVSSMRYNESSDVILLCKTAYKKYKLINKQNQTKKRDELYKSNADKWNEKYPKSFRYRTPDEICSIISKDEQSLKLAWNYISPCKANGRLSKDLIERTKQGLIQYYQALDFPCYKLQKLLR